MQNMKIFLEDAVKYFPERLTKLGISGVDAGNVYQKVMDKIGGEEKFSDFLMGYLNLLYDNFDMYFFKGFTEPSLLYHISKKESELKRLIEDFYTGKIVIGPKDYYLSKLKTHEKKRVLETLNTFVNLGNLAPDVYERYQKGNILDDREKEIKEKYPIVRQVKETKERIEEKEVKVKTEEKKEKKKEKTFAFPISLFSIFFFTFAGIALLFTAGRLIDLITKFLRR